MANRWGNSGNSERLYFFWGGVGSKITEDGDCNPVIKRHLLLRRKAMPNLDSILKIRDLTLPTNISSQSSVFSSIHVCIWEFDYKESWSLKNWSLYTVVLEKTFESPLDCKETKPVNPKGIQSLNIHLKDWCWSWSSNTLTIWCKELTHWKRPWCWERLNVRAERNDRGWDGWSVSPVWWMWIWTSPGSCWWTGKPSIVQYVGSQRVRHKWVTEVNWTE